MIPKLVPTTPPAFQPITLDQVKEQLKLPKSQSDHDAELNRLIDFAIGETIAATSYAGGQQSFDWSPLVLEPRTPLPLYNVSDAVAYYKDADGAEQAVDPASYALDASKVKPQLVLADLTASWPTVSQSEPLPYRVAITAGYADLASVEPWFVQACLSLVDRIWQGDTSDSGFGRVFEALERRRYASYL